MKLFQTKLEKEELKRIKRRYMMRNMYPDDLKRMRKLTKEQKEEIYQKSELWMDEDERSEMREYVERYTHRNYFFSKPAVQKALIVLLVIAILIGPVIAYTNYQTKKKYDTPMPDQQITLQNGTIITLIGDNQLKSGDVDKYLNDIILKQPLYLLDNCKYIYLLSSDRFKEYSQNEELENAYAYSKSRELSVYVQCSLQDDDLKTLTHELWHIYDFTHGDYTTDSSNLEDFQSLYNARPDSIDEYGATSSREFFAQAGTMYVYEPEVLKEKNIDVYNYFESLEK